MTLVTLLVILILFLPFSFATCFSLFPRSRFGGMVWYSGGVLRPAKKSRATEQMVAYYCTYV